MTEILLTDKISKKIEKLGSSRNSEDIKLLKNILTATSQIEHEGIGNAKKVLNTDNIFVIRIGTQYRLFYTVERNESNEKFILLLDIIKRTNYKDNYFNDLIKVFNEYKKG